MIAYRLYTYKVGKEKACVPSSHSVVRKLLIRKPAESRWQERYGHEKQSLIHCPLVRHIRGNAN